MAGSEASTAQPGHSPARPHPIPASLSTLRPTWSVPAAMRAARATIVAPSLFALTFEVIGDLQMALFAVFGAFATLVLASFGGTRRDKLIAHLGLAVGGSVVLTIGTAVSGTAWLAAIVTIPSRGRAPRVITPTPWYAFRRGRNAPRKLSPAAAVRA